jgi:hypothetical protein
MDEAAWALSALLALGFFIAAILSTGFLQFGWFALAIGMTVVAYVRFRARGDSVD